MKNWLVLITSIIVLGGCTSMMGSYEGETKDGKRHGYGTYDTNLGRTYSGYWNEGKLEGIVTITYSNSDIKYVGEVFDQEMKIGVEGYKPHGKGVFTYGDGSTLEGKFDKDRGGYWDGKMEYASGEIFIGTHSGVIDGSKFTGTYISSSGEEQLVDVNLMEYVQRKEEKKRFEENEIETREIIFTALFDRCSEFGWISEDDISACIKQEAYRDLQMQQQQYEMRQLEERLAYSYSSEPEPTFLDLLNQYAQIKQTQQMQKDIQRLKSANRSMRSKQNTQRALKFLYQGRGN